MKFILSDIKISVDDQLIHRYEIAYQNFLAQKINQLGAYEQELYDMIRTLRIRESILKTKNVKKTYHDNLNKEQSNLSNQIEQLSQKREEIDHLLSCYRSEILELESYDYLKNYKEYFLDWSKYVI